MKKLKKHIEEEIQLNLTPMMDLFVALIPFLILSASFNQLGGIDLESPGASAGNKIESKNSSDELWLIFEVKADAITVQGYNKDFDSPREKIHASFNLSNLESFKKYLFQLDGAKYKMGPSLFHASSETRYDQAIAFLNVMRGTRNVSNIVIASGAVE